MVTPVASAEQLRAAFLRREAKSDAVHNRSLYEPRPSHQEKRLLIVAGSYRAAAEIARERGAQRWVLVTHAQHVRGVSPAHWDVAFGHGHHWLRDLPEILGYLRACGFESP